MFQPDLLRDKRILITGGGTGLGKGMAHRFLQLGATVYICGRRREVLSKTEAELNRVVPNKIQSFPLRRSRSAAGGKNDRNDLELRGPLDILVNNAAGNFLARTEELSPGAFEAVLGIVLTGTINLTMACGRRWLKEAHAGTVLNIAATYTSTGSAYVVPSAMAKAGVVALTRSLAVEWGDRGIRMNAIAPGPIPTEGAFSRLLPRPELEEFARQRNPTAPLRYRRGTGQSWSFPGKRWRQLHQRRSDRDGRRRTVTRRRRIHQLGKTANRR